MSDRSPRGMGSAVGSLFLGDGAVALTGGGAPPTIRATTILPLLGRGLPVSRAFSVMAFVDCLDARSEWSR
jgi:hypothetical protein